jgi:hypothetical protein
VEDWFGSREKGIGFYSSRMHSFHMIILKTNLEGGCECYHEFFFKKSIN